MSDALSFLFPAEVELVKIYKRLPFPTWAYRQNRAEYDTDNPPTKESDIHWEWAPAVHGLDVVNGKVKATELMKITLRHDETDTIGQWIVLSRAMFPEMVASIVTLRQILEARTTQPRRR